MGAIACAPIEQMGYDLAANVHACEVDGFIYFLDAARDRYCRAGETASRSLLAGMGGSGPPSPPTDALVDAGLLVWRTDDAPRSFLCDHPAPSGDLHGRLARRAAPRARNVCWIARLAVQASFVLRARGFLHALEWGQTGQLAGSATLSPEALAGDVAAFQSARSLLPMTPRCLLDSLLLKRWIARAGLPTDLVIGVRSLPFAAHCWVEHRGIVLNGSRDGIANFKPICVS